MSENSSTPTAIELVFHGILSAADGAPLRRSFSLLTLQSIMQRFPEDIHYLPRPSDHLLACIEDALLAQEGLDEDAKALRPALFLCVALLRASPVNSSSARASGLGLKIQVTATENFPVGAGLGSSAAFSVALAGALVHYQGASGKMTTHTEKSTLELINAYAFAAEVIMHGAPSGVDNTVAAFGGTLVFRKLPEPSFQHIACDLNQFRFLLVNTRVPRSTKEQVANVRRLLEADRVHIEEFFREIDGIASSFIDTSNQQALSEEKLASQVARNHEILNALGVGHPQIERVALICRQYGATTKLTGAGGGGCTLSLLPNSLSDAALTQLVAELEGQQNDFQCFVSAVGGAGFRVESSE